jgi:RNA polymerase sigma-70 factor (ECF subfamily)
VDANPREEAERIKAASQGNLGAFAELVQTHRMRVLRTATGVLGSVDEAEDVAQDVFIKAWEHLPDYDPRGSFASWLYRITVNTALDVLRKRRADISLDDAQLPSSKEDPEGMALRKDERQRVQAAIAALPPAARAALILREYEQLSYKEIADVLDIPIGTVMSRLNYARRALSDSLAPEHNAAEV